MSRYGTIPSSFWLADPRTRGLGSLAACLYFRARSASLIGVLQLSPRALAVAHHDATPELVNKAIGELERRGLARWWPDLEILGLAGAADYDTRDNAHVAAGKLLADLPPDVVAYLIEPPSEPPITSPTLTTSQGGPAEGVGGSEPEPVPQPDPEQDPEPSGSLTLPLVVAAKSVRRKDPAKAKAKMAAIARRYSPEQIEDAQLVLNRLTQLRRELIGPRCAALTVADDGEHVLARLADGATIAQALLVVESEAHKVRQGGTRDYFDSVTPFRPSNWPQRRAQAETWDAARLRQAPGTRRPHHATPHELEIHRQPADPGDDGP